MVATQSRRVDGADFVRVRRALFLGSKAFGLASLRILREAEPEITWTVIHPDDHADDRSVLEQFKQYAETELLDFHLIDTKSEANKIIAALDFDVGFVCGWYWLLSESECGSDCAPLYGIHHSALPKLRGGAPVVWAIMRGDSVVGSTFFKISPGMDDGDIVLQIEHRIQPDDTITDVIDALQQKWLKKLPKLWKELAMGNVRLIPQNHSAATYCSQRRPEDGLIDWRMAALDVHNFVRAQSWPYPGAYTHFQGAKIIVERTQLFETEYRASAGQILAKTELGILVGCGGDSAIWITEVRGNQQPKLAFSGAGRFVR